jgi:transglutaminase-like putative cysteine protease
MRLSVRHITSYAYEPPADRGALRLRVYPSAYDAQKVHGWSVSVNGIAVPPLMTTASGDRESIWTANGALANVEVVAEGEVEVADASGLVRGLKESIRPGVYLRSTPLTEADERIKTLAGSVSDAEPLKRLHALSAAVRDAVDYRTGSTDQRTTAAQALKLGKGVCQDHAHVFIAAARAQGTPARYVVGYLLALEGNLTETHAWAEAYVPELGWIGFDPANRICPTDRYVRLSSGLDSADAAPIRGNVSGAHGESLVASVAVTQKQMQGQNQQTQ